MSTSTTESVLDYIRSGAATSSSLRARGIQPLFERDGLKRTVPENPLVTITRPLLVAHPRGQ